VSKVRLSVVLLAAFGCFDAIEASADSCPTVKDEIATDRPSQTNSSLVVPVGSLQGENGLNFTAPQGSQTLDGTNTRLRFGLAPCLEFLVDLPSYSATVHGSGSSGFSDVAPAVKWQISPLPGTVDLSIILGAALPTGSPDISGQGVQPYLQFPWSWQLHDGWSLSGMATEFVRPSDPTNRLVTETTFAVTKNLTQKASLFVEYVGDYPQNSSSSQFLNSGGTYRLSPTQQVDFRLAFGLNRNAPAYIVGIGYSFRLDGVFFGKQK
jgi:Putative MetA-pathway of phenol degradation